MWEVEIERTKALAFDANVFIEKLTEELTRYAFNDCTERMLIVLPLLKSAIDMGAAATRLLIMDPIQYGSAAEAMLRPQLERFTRAVYFAAPTPADDAAVHAFFESDVPPSVLVPNRTDGKKRKLTFDELTRLVADELARQYGRVGDPVSKEFAEAVALITNDLHGAVHGGNLVVRRYLMDASVIYCPLPLSEGAIIRTMAALSFLAAIQVAHLHGSPFQASAEFDVLLRAVFPKAPKAFASYSHQGWNICRT
jgi:hypothetical protein